MEIKQGDKVRVSKDAPKFFRRYNTYRIFEVEHQVVDIEDGIALLDSIPSKYVTTIPTKYLVKVDAEAKEPKYHKGDRVKFKNIYDLQKVKDKSFRWMLVMFASKEATITAVEDNGFYRVDIDPSIGGINDDMIECKVELTEQTEAEKKPNFGSIKIPVEVDLSDDYWDAYTADLAKEIVLKTVNSASDKRPSVIAEYATDVAKSVVEGLKRK